MIYSCYLSQGSSNNYGGQTERRGARTGSRQPTHKGEARQAGKYLIITHKSTKRNNKNLCCFIYFRVYFTTKQRVIVTFKLVLRSPFFFLLTAPSLRCNPTCLYNALWFTIHNDPAERKTGSCQPVIRLSTDMKNESSGPYARNTKGAHTHNRVVSFFVSDGMRRTENGLGRSIQSRVNSARRREITRRRRRRRKEIQKKIKRPSQL